MSRAFLLLLLAALSMGSGSAAAALCTPVMSAHSLDYGRLSAADIENTFTTKRGAGVSLASKTVMLTVTCQKEVRLRIRFTDETPQGKKLFHFGKSGVLRVSLDEIKMDSRPVRAIRINRTGERQSEHGESTLRIHVDDKVVFVDGTEVKGKVFTMQLTLQPLVSKEMFKIREDMHLDTGIRILLEPQEE